MKKIVITEFMDESAVLGLKDSFDVIYDPGLVDDEKELLSQVSDADGIIVRNRTQVKDKLLAQAAQLRVVGRLGVGLDNIDLLACKEKGIKVFPATGANDAAVAEYVITATLMLLRRAYLSFAAMADGDWPRTDLMGCEASGKCLGLVGFGGIGRETAVRAKAMGMRVIAHDPYLSSEDIAWQTVENVSWAELLEISDVISLHVPLTQETKHLINEQTITNLKKGAIIINAARGGVVDEQALITALRSGQLGGAALDVFEQEPLDAASGVALKGIPNLILTPHIGGVTVESNQRVSALTAENVRKALEV